ncbi:hypothetical protein Ahy_A02g005398 isoform E [Arachis hypogaea]|uniref:Uncharacterized protein n=1 Tax=Arachis hypogaea TaxID=3818 RepID=A0A445E6L8_ARAHY|nr:hypothetical protein Ahy_A02g005398 isoform E [Arachis hypogaea]
MGMCSIPMRILATRRGSLGISLRRICRVA